MGEIEIGIVEQAVKQGIPVPERIQDRPVLKFGLELFFKAFLDLTCDRTSGFDVGSIPTMTILSYASYHEIYGIDAFNFLEIIRGIDGEYLRHQTAKQKKETAAAKRRAKRK